MCVHTHTKQVAAATTTGQRKERQERKERESEREKDSTETPEGIPSRGEGSSVKVNLAVLSEAPMSPPHTCTPPIYIHMIFMWVALPPVTWEDSQPSGMVVVVAAGRKCAGVRFFL